jgi:hypothetical protein
MKDDKIFTKFFFEKNVCTIYIILYYKYQIINIINISYAYPQSKIIRLLLFFLLIPYLKDNTILTFY